jgi:hypothetical protein
MHSLTLASYGGYLSASYSGWLRLEEIDCGQKTVWPTEVVVKKKIPVLVRYRTPGVQSIYSHFI